MTQKSNFEIHSKETISDALISKLKKISSSNSNNLKKLYFAGPWFTDKGQQLYEACKKVYDIVEHKSAYSVFFPKDYHSNNPKDCFDSDVHAILDCDVLVALIDEKDVGTAWEIGMAFAQEKDIYLLGFDETSFMTKTNLMLAYTGKCFTFDKFAKFLTHGLGHDEFIDTEKTWEVLE